MNEVPQRTELLKEALDALRKRHPPVTDDKLKLFEAVFVALAEATLFIKAEDYEWIQHLHIDEMRGDGDTFVIPENLVDIVGKLFETDDQFVNKLHQKSMKDYDHIKRYLQSPIYAAAVLSLILHDKKLNKASLKMLFSAAIELNNSEMIELLIDYYVDNQVELSVNFLHLAAGCGCDYFIKKVLSETNSTLLHDTLNIPEDAFKMTPLHFAACNNNITGFKLLFENGAKASLEIKDKEGLTPVDYLHKNKNTALLEYLVLKQREQVLQNLFATLRDGVFQLSLIMQGKMPAKNYPVFFNKVEPVQSSSKSDSIRADFEKEMLDVIKPISGNDPIPGETVEAKIEAINDALIQALKVVDKEDFKNLPEIDAIKKSISNMRDQIEVSKNQPAPDIASLKK